jgi:eukaryotic-like serine/threonine-protein kinase
VSEFDDVRLILPPDVRITPIADLPVAVAAGISHEPGDLCVTRPRNRRPSSVVGPDAAMLLRVFRSPTTVTDAVMAYSATMKVDPRTVIEDALAVIRDLVEDGILVADGTSSAGSVRASLAPGDRVGDAEILAAVQVLSDMEVYRARRGQWAQPAALKIARDRVDRGARDSLRRESAVLEFLGGQGAPARLDVGDHDGRPFLLTSWVQGVALGRAASEARRLDDGDRALLALCSTVVRAYAGLHERGVIHGDLHPRNVLVGADGIATIIDFGLARAPELRVGPRHRGGIDVFLEPELAAAYLTGDPLPASSEAGEQYALGALLYFMITNSHTHTFATEQAPMLRQVLDNPVSPFARSGVEHLPSVESVVGRALAKRPGDRHPTVTAMAAALDEAVRADLDVRGRDRGEGQARAMVVDDDAAAVGPRPGVRRRVPPGLTDVLDRVLDRADPAGSSDLSELPTPTASVTSGAAGVALALLRAAEVRSDGHALALADLWSAAAVAAAGETRATGLPDRRAFATADAERDGIDLGTASLLHHASGVQVVRALVARARGDGRAEGQAVEAFSAAAGVVGRETDVAFGLAGTLLGCSLFVESTSTNVDLARPSAVGNDLCDRLTAEVLGRPGPDGGPSGRRFGAAHGWAGELYAILRWSVLTDRTVSDALLDRIDSLAAVGRPEGRARWWPINVGDPAVAGAVAASWCTGAAGFVPLWLLAARTLGEDRFTHLALQAGWAVFDDREPAVANLCCGLAGRAYALLALYRHTGDDAWRARAGLLGEQAAAVHDRDRRLSLFKGEMGLALLAADLTDPDASSFPMYEPRL